MHLTKPLAIIVNVLRLFGGNVSWDAKDLHPDQGVHDRFALVLVELGQLLG